MVVRVVVVLCVGLLSAIAARADGGLLWSSEGRVALIAPRIDEVHTVSANRPSLIAGTTGNSLLAPYPVRPGKGQRGHVPDHVARLLDLIASAEAGSAGYDAVVWAARIKPPKPPTQMTLGEIDAWTRATPRQHHAIGRYQFIPSTLRRLVRITGAGPDQVFTPRYQDQLALILLQEAGLERYQSQAIGRVTFMNNLAKIWAGLPNASGRSHYHGYAGNKATISLARFHAEMAAIYGP